MGAVLPPRKFVRVANEGVDNALVYRDTILLAVCRCVAFFFAAKASTIVVLGASVRENLGVEA